MNWRAVRGHGICDSGLPKRFPAGDEEACIEPIRQHHQVMVRFARSYVPSQSAAEDIVEATWLATLRRLTSVEPGHRSKPGCTRSS